MMKLSGPVYQPMVWRADAIETLGSYSRHIEEVMGFDVPLLESQILVEEILVSRIHHQSQRQRHP